MAYTYTWPYIWHIWQRQKHSKCKRCTYTSIKRPYISKMREHNVYTCKYLHIYNQTVYGSLGYGFCLKLLTLHTPTTTPLPTCGAPRALSTTIESTTTSLTAVLSDPMTIINAALLAPPTHVANDSQEPVPEGCKGGEGGMVRKNGVQGPLTQALMTATNITNPVP
jgi:hypothetical protein